MAQRIINESILVVRNGKRIVPAIGKAFDLTEREITDLERVRPQAISEMQQTAVDPQSEVVAAEPVEPEAVAETEAVEYASMTKDQLTALAESMGIEVPARATKDRLIDLITAAEGSEDL